MLYLMLVVVFGQLAKKWWLFLLLGYCKKVDIAIYHTTLHPAASTSKIRLMNLNVKKC